ncbi:MAG: hypothetical protein Q4F13_00765 [Pseudomonadota bacterium]|nr:hypothetical protein [Pseudomonadota bacterium]
MKVAPAVIYPTGRSGRLLVLLVLPWLLAVFILLAGLLEAYNHAVSWPALIGQAMLSLVALLLSGWSLGRFWQAQAVCQLAWDGQGWYLDGADRAGQVTVCLDVQHAMLLCYWWPDRSGRTWLWADAQAFVQRWHLLRCALYSPGPSVGRHARQGPQTSLERA